MPYYVQMVLATAINCGLSQNTAIAKRFPVEMSDLDATINILKLQLRTLDCRLLGQDKKKQQRINTPLYIFQALCHIFPQTQADIMEPWLASRRV
jgi:hypothetical protein